MSSSLSSRTVPVDEDTIRALSKSVSKLVPDGDNSESISSEKVKQLEGVIDCLLQTAALVNISAAHRAAACNSLCAFIERCQLSTDEGFHCIVWENDLWTRLFEVFLERSDNAKAKSMRQVLLVLTGMLLKDAPPQSSGLQDDAVSRLLDIICRYQIRTKIKPALQALAHFISKDLISINQLIDIYRNYSGAGTDPDGGLSAYQLLLRQFLAWVRHHDTAPAAGHLITNFLTKSTPQRRCAEEKTGVLPVWIEPLEGSIRDSPEAINEFKHHVFPEIFRLDLDGYLQFLYHLQLDRHLGIKSTIHSPNPSVFTANDCLEITLLFTALQVGKELGLVKDVDYEAFKIVEVQGGALKIPDILFGRLLAHTLPAVRLAALSLLVSSTAVTRPITSGTFQCLKRHLSYFHAETDANFRGELLSIMQRLFSRLRASTATLSKALANNRTSLKLIGSQGVVAGRGNELSSCEILDKLQHHTEFVSWYLQFLSLELRPTSSYQRHILALKSLNFVLKSGLDSSIPHRNLSKQAQGDLKWEHQWDVFSPRLVRLLFDLMLDPFDDVRNEAALNLKLKSEIFGKDSTAVTLRVPTTSTCSSLVLGPTGFRYVELANVVQFIGRAETMMLRTGRADHADGVARAYEYVFSQCAIVLQSNRELKQTEQHWWSIKSGVVIHLIEQLERTIAIASRNLLTAVNGYPVHGIFASFRYIVNLPEFYPLLSTFSREEIQLWKDIHRRIFVCLESIWSCVREVLCSDAPEGHVPEELEDELEVDTKDILSYSWRALKEACALLRAIISKAPVCTSSRDSILEPSDFNILGKLCFAQLAELRHRGAFSTVSQTFAACCSRCIGMDDVSIQELPNLWYQDALLCIRNKASMITRRSAGIPSLISGIMSAEPGGRLFRKAMGDLFVEASPDAESSNIQESCLPQVHALNCLKEIFTTTKLGQSSESYIGQGLDLAASKLGSKNWPIRNCGLMLFKALLDRLLGSSDTQKWREQKPAKISRLSYGNYANLLEIMAKLLVPRDSRGMSEVEVHKNMSTSMIRATEGVFPALQILQQAPPPEANRETIRGLILHLTRSPYWHVRDMAARTFASGLRQTECVSVIRNMLSSLDKRQNSFHGLLLCVKYSLITHIESSHSSTTGACCIIEDLLERFDDIFRKNTCPLTKATYLDLINLFQKAMILQSTSSPELIEILDKNTRQLTAEVHTHFETLRYNKHSGVTSALALLRRSMSYYLVINFVLAGTAHFTVDEASGNRVGSLQTILYELGEVDPDNCCAILDELGEMLNHSRFEAVITLNPEIPVSIYRLSLNTSDLEVRSTAQSVLASLLSEDEVRCAFFAGLDGNSASQTFDSLKTQCLYGPPSCVESAIRLQGFFLDHQLRLLQFWNQKILHDQAQYVRTLQKLLYESNSFSTRHAAVLSISGLRYIWTMENGSVVMPSPLLSFGLVVYDILNDDDDEIRELAARIATRAIMGKRYRRGMRDAIPLLASQRLAEYLARVYPDSSELCDGAMRRLMGCDEEIALFKISFQETLARAQKEDTALFVQEKQNLFIDAAREVVIWSRVLKSVSSKAIPRNLAQKFTKWVMDGISLLAATGKVEIDGPLGWASKAEVFTLGMRVIYGAEVLLNWRMRSKKVSVRGSEIRRKLRDFADAGRSGIHELWIDRVEAVLAYSVLVRLALVKEKIEMVVNES